MTQIPAPQIDNPSYLPHKKLQDKVVLITGGDSGIGAATALLFAKEGAKVIVVYFDEDADAARIVDACAIYGGACTAINADLKMPDTAPLLIQQTLDAYGSLNCLVLNAGTQTTQEDIQNISYQQLKETFETNVFSMFYLVQSARPYLKGGDSIITTTSVTAYRGSPELLDYSSTKGAIVSFTRSLSRQLAPENIRVNGVAPGPVWTPLVIDSFDKEKLAHFGQDQPLGRAAQPYEIAPSYLFLASEDSSYITGQIIHANGGEIING